MRVLYVVEVVVDALPAGSRLSAQAGGVSGVVEVLQARITSWGYPPHCHDTWAVRVVDDGAIDYRLDRRRRQACRGTVTILPPDITHDGHPATAGNSFSKRKVYLSADFLPPSLYGPAVDHTNLTDPNLATTVRQLHTALLCPGDRERSRTFVMRAPQEPSRAPCPVAGPARGTLGTSRLP